MANSQTFYRAIPLVLFVVFVSSLETAAKHDKSISGGKSKKVEWLEPMRDKGSKKMIGSRNGPGFLYGIQVVDTDLMKIGLSKDPHQRVKTLQTGCPFELKVVLVWEVSNMQAAESAAHAAMAAYNIRGQNERIRAQEWFFLPPGELKEVNEIVITSVEKANLKIQLVYEIA